MRLKYRSLLVGFALFVFGLPLSQAQETPATELIRQWASGASASSSFGTDGWGPQQATGEPNTPDCGDYRSAWASLNTTGVETLTLVFDEPVIPSQVNIHQTYNPGAITSVLLVNSSTGETSALPDSADPVGNTACPGVFSLDVIGFAGLVDTVVIEFDMSLVGSWNEIDAVELVGSLDTPPSSTFALAAPTSEQWAESAKASSQFGDPSWSASQATGEPNTTECGDVTTAWASASATGQDTLTLNFAQAVIPTAIKVYQTYNPGAITGISVTNSTTSQTVDLPNSADPVGNTDCPGVFSLPVTGVGLVDRVTLTLDQTLTGNWNEIDAVQLVGYVLSEQVSSGGLTVTYPQGWVSSGEEPDYIYIASDDATLTIVEDGDSANQAPNTVGLSIALPASIAEIGLTGATPVDILTEFVTLAESTGAVEPYPALGENAVITTMQGSPVAPEGAVVIATTFNGETILVAVQVGPNGTYEDVEALAVAILQTITAQ